MIIHPNFNPVAVNFGVFSIHWYALSYIVAFILFMWLGRRRIAQNNSPFTKDQLDDLLTYGILGVILGGRLGYCLFYQPAYFAAHPVDIFKVWQGGMSFHGGFLGVVLASVLFAKKHQISWVKCADGIAPLVPLGLGSGRLGNFINGELWGRLTDPDAFWAMGFPTAYNDDLALLPTLPEKFHNAFMQYNALPRHPSPLYECALEGIVLFIILWLFSKKPRPAGQVAALFLIGYGLFRFLIEFTRQPDGHLGLLSLGLSMGQWLSLPMLLIGVIWFMAAKHKTV